MSERVHHTAIWAFNKVTPPAIPTVRLRCRPSLTSPTPESRRGRSALHPKPRRIRIEPSY